MAMFTSRPIEAKCDLDGCQAARLRRAIKALYDVVDETARNSYGTNRFEKTFDYENPAGYAAWKLARRVMPQLKGKL